MKLEFGDKCYGTVGERTEIKDRNGDNLYIGDVVNVKCRNMSDFLSVIVKDGDDTFVMGIRTVDISTSKDFKVYKEKSYASMKVGDEVHHVKYVNNTEDTQKEEEKSKKKEISHDKALKALIGMLVIADILGIGKDSDKNEHKCG